MSIYSQFVFYIIILIITSFCIGLYVADMAITNRLKRK